MRGDSSADIRAARDQARRETEERIDKAIAESGVDNPYTGLPFSGVEEFLAYGQRLQADIRASNARKAAEARKAQATQEQSSAATKDAPAGEPKRERRREKPVRDSAPAAPARGAKKSFLITILNNGYPLRFESTSIIDIYNCLYHAIYGNRDHDFWEMVFVNLGKLKDGGYFAWQLDSEITIYAITDKVKPEYAPGDEPGDDYMDEFDSETEENGE